MVGGVISRKVPGGMSEKDLAELYTYLELFVKVYAGYDQQVETLMNGILAIYRAEYRREDADAALRELENPRNAGRKRTYTQADADTVSALSSEGHTIRQIAEITGIPRSTVQRLLCGQG